MSDETPQEPTQEQIPAADVPTEPMPATPPPPPTPDMPYSAAMDTPAAPGRKGKRTLAVVVAALVVVGAGGAAFAFFQLRGSSDVLMSQVPASADFVATVYLNPAASQKVDLFRMTDKFPVLGSESDLTQRLNTYLDQAGQSVGLNHNDFQWIGSQAAVVVDLPGAAAPNIEVLINVDDMSAAKATLAKARSNPGLSGWTDTQYKGVTVSSAGSAGGGGAYAFVGNTLVLANTTGGVDSIIDTDQGGASLADSADFKATSAGLPDGRLAFAYVNVNSLLQLAQSMGSAAGVSPGALDITALQAIRGLGMTVSAEPTGLAMDVNESFDPSKMSDSMKALYSGAAHDNPLLSFVPSDAFAVGQMENVNALFAALIDQVSKTSPDVTAKLGAAGVTGPSGLLSTLTGDLAFELAPGAAGTPVSGALLLGTNDTTKFDAAVAKLRDLAATSQSCSSSGSSGVTASGVVLPGTQSSSCTTTVAKWQTEEYKGTTINYLPPDGTAPTLAYATVDGAGVIGIGPDSIKQLIDAKAGANITSNSAFTTAQAVVPSQRQFFYVDVQGMLQGIATASPDQAASMQQAIALLKPVKAVVIGAESDATHSHSKLLIEIP